MKWSFPELRNVPDRERALAIVCYADRRHPVTVTIVDTAGRIHLPRVQHADQQTGESWIPCACSAGGHIVVGTLVVQALGDRNLERPRSWRVDVSQVSRRHQLP